MNNKLVSLRKNKLCSIASYNSVMYAFTAVYLQNTKTNIFDCRKDSNYNSNYNSTETKYLSNYSEIHIE